MASLSQALQAVLMGLQMSGTPMLQEGGAIEVPQDFPHDPSVLLTPDEFAQDVAAGNIYGQMLQEEEGPQTLDDLIAAALAEMAGGGGGAGGDFRFYTPGRGTGVVFNQQTGEYEIVPLYEEGGDGGSPYAGAYLAETQRQNAFNRAAGLLSMLMQAAPDVSISPFYGGFGPYGGGTLLEMLQGGPGAPIPTRSAPLDLSTLQF